MSVRGSIRRVLTRAAGRAGYELVPRWGMRDFVYARRLRELFAAYGIERVIDVGANEGQFYRLLRDQVGFTGPVDSFEPVPELSARLQALSRSDPGWTVHAGALGAEAGRLRLNVGAGTDFSSFLRPVDSEAWAGRNVTAREVEVEVGTLDAVFPDPSRLERTFLKLDTQGFDLEVIKGGARTVAAMPMVQTEVSFRPFYRGMPSYRESLDMLAERGFVVADMIQVHDRVPAGGAYEFDLLAVRPRAERG